MKKLFLFLLWSFNIFSQNNPISLKIITITRTENTYKTDYIFNIQYSITNNTNQELCLFLKQNSIVANATSSLQNAVVYRVYQNSKLVDIPIFGKRTILNNDPFELKNFITKIQKKNDSIVKAYHDKGGISKDTLWILKNQDLVSEILTLKPQETRTMQASLVWDKLRTITYQKQEYYLDEKDTFQIDLSLYCLKKPFESYLSSEEKKKIIENQNFIEGNFTTEKMELPLNKKEPLLPKALFYLL